MTDQQAPEWNMHEAAKWLRETSKDTDLINEFESIADLLEASEKRIAELEVHAENGWHQYRHWSSRYLEVSAERDQALASVGAVIEKAAVLAQNGDEPPDFPDWLSARVEGIRSLNPDATAALNEMLHDAWDEGHRNYLSGENPYRKTKP